MASRTRNYATIVYPESAPSNWMDILRESCVMGFISPVHDKDIECINNVTGDFKYKKAHHHVLILFDGVKTEKQWDEFKRLFGGTVSVPVHSSVGYARYLCHIDNPEKAQYSAADVISLGGGDYLSLIGRTCDRYQYIEQMIDYSIENKVTSYRDLYSYAMKYNANWFKTLCDGGSHMLRDVIKENRSDIMLRESRLQR